MTRKNRKRKRSRRNEKAPSSSSSASSVQAVSALNDAKLEELLKEIWALEATAPDSDVLELASKLSDAPLSPRVAAVRSYY